MSTLPGCHQIANRILAATGDKGKPPITVAGARGYRISRFVYGEYGTPSQWAELRVECKMRTAQPVDAHADLLALTDEGGSRGKMMPVLQKEQNFLRGRIAEIGFRATNRSLTAIDVATQVNLEVNASLNRLASELGASEFERLFDWPADEEIVLVNPDIAGKVPYSSR
ncbi:MAG: hypothetical protein HZB47_05355 [Nitrosomonadales bacterium]|nr:hypothetical protein [Nitrosomonadales bacterium]